MTAMVWFRTDLRVRDNPALYHAGRDAPDGVIGVFANCPAQWRAHHWGPNKIDFVMRSAQALAADLAEINIPLLIIRADHFSDVPERLLALLRRHGCTSLYFNHEYEVNERRRDEAVSALCARVGCVVHAFHDQTILDVAELRTGAGGPYTVFTPFRKKWCGVFKESSASAPLPKPRRQRAMPAKPDRFPRELIKTEAAAGDVWPTGQRHAERRLDRFIAQRLADYAHQRDLPACDSTSKLSAYLACGVLSARQCLHAALDANGGRVDSGRKGATTWISELVWREFYRAILRAFPRVCMDQPYNLATRRIRWRHDEAQFAAWCEGCTGFPIVDAGMRQLARTGWMHNRVRMIVAMFLTKDLLIDWRWGERYFLEQLIDVDFANNNGGWQWSASTGTDAAPYFRIFNPASQSRRFDPAGEYIRRWVPELSEVPAGPIHDPDSATRRKCGYPLPIVDRSATRQRVLDAFKGARGKAR